MPHETKNKRCSVLQTRKMRGRSAAKKLPTHLNAEGTTDEEVEPSLRSVVALVGNMNFKMGPYKKRLEEMSDASSAHTVFTAPPVASTSRATDEGKGSQMTICLSSRHLHGRS